MCICSPAELPTWAASRKLLADFCWAMSFSWACGRTQGPGEQQLRNSRCCEGSYNTVHAVIGWPHPSHTLTPPPAAASPPGCPPPRSRATPRPAGPAASQGAQRRRRHRRHSLSAPHARHATGPRQRRHWLRPPWPATESSVPVSRKSVYEAGLSIGFGLLGLRQAAVCRAQPIKPRQTHPGWLSHCLLAYYRSEIFGSPTEPCAPRSRLHSVTPLPLQRAAPAPSPT